MKQPRTALAPLDATTRGVLAFHVIIGAYGFWLPNDPRGSWSTFVRTWEIFRVGGDATKTSTRSSVAGIAHNSHLRYRTKEKLKHPAVVFNGHQALAIAQGFQRMVEKAGYGVFACSILPKHVHLVLRRHTYKVEQVVRLLKAEASARLTEIGQHPLAAFMAEDGTLPSPWVRNCWKVFLNSAADINRAVRYVENNPVKEGKRPQPWSFVTPFSGGS